MPDFQSLSDTEMELMKVTITNTSNIARKVTPTAAIPLYCRSADNIRDHRHVTSLLHRIETTEDGIIVNPTLTFDERGHKKNNVVYGIREESGQYGVGIETYFLGSKGYSIFSYTVRFKR